MFKKIRSRIILSIIAITLVTLLAVGGLSYYVSYKAIFKSHAEVISQSSNVSLNIIDEYARLIATDFTDAAFTDMLKKSILSGGDVSEDCEKQAIGFCSNIKKFSGYAVFSADRSVIFSYGGVDFDADYFKNIGDKLSPERLYAFIAGKNEPDLNIIIPIIASDEICGYQNIRLSSDELNDMLLSQYASFEKKEIHCFVTADNNYVFPNSSNDIDVYRYSPDFDFKPALTYDNEYFTIRSQADCGLEVILLFSADDYNSAIGYMRAFISLLSLAMLVVSFVIATLFADGITNPLTKLYSKIKHTGVTNNFDE